jgi:hypothetical protein
MKQIIIWCFFILFTSFILYADELELSNGDIITGTIVSMDEEEVVIETEYGRLTIKRKFVKKGIFAGEDAVIITSENPYNQDSAVIDYSLDIPGKGLVCELLFDNSLSDTSGTMYTIKNINNIPFCTGIDGIENHAVSSDGSGRYLVITDYKELDVVNSFTISFWIYVEIWGKTQYILSKWTSTEGEKAEGKFAIHTKQGFVLCYIVDAAGTYYNVFTEKPMKLHVWNHIAILFDKGKTQIYVNNQLAGNKTFGFTGLKQDSSPLYILTAKAVKGNTYAYYNLFGMLDNLRIYSRSLSEEEIAALYFEKKQD